MQELMTRLARNLCGFAALLAISLLLGWRPLIDTFALALRDDEFTHILLILPVSVALVCLEWRSLLPMVAWKAPIGSMLLSLSVLIACTAFVWPTPDVQLAIRIFALVVWWIGAFVFCFGYRAAQSVLFPLLFLFAMVPLPQVVLGGIVFVLQQGSVWAACMLFAAFDIPVAQDVFLISIPGLTLQVAQECSSIRSSLMLLVATIVLAHLLLRSPWKKALLITISLPLSVAKNGLRIFTIAMLGTRVDPGYLTGRLHHDGGGIFLGIALIIVFLLLWLLRRGEGMPFGDSLIQKRIRPAPSID
ncbi:MAG: exosortase/archaeosortase family protein [Formivibrio sp.]|nr:exosortase/archaeosortase family protein [Formivibrio sp.]